MIPLPLTLAGMALMFFFGFLAGRNVGRRRHRCASDECAYDVLTVGRLAMRGVPLKWAERSIVILRDALEDRERETEERRVERKEHA